MPMQSEVNDTLMECLLFRLKAEKWHDKVGLGEILAKIGQEVGFVVRLEDHYKAVHPGGPEYLKELLRKRPFLYLGYYLHVDSETKRVAACLDINRFFAGAAYLSGSYVEKSAVGPKTALALAGYALSFGVPPAFFESAYDVLKKTALAALEGVGGQLVDEDVQAEVHKHVYAGLPDIRDVFGLRGALEQNPRVIWFGDFVPPEKPLGAWADEPAPPWVQEATKVFDLRDFGLNEIRSVQPEVAGRLPPTPARVLQERAVRQANREKKRDERAERKGRHKRAGAQGSDPPTSGSGSEEEDEEDGADSIVYQPSLNWSQATSRTADSRRGGWGQRHGARDGGGE
jgi:hypothetical protein